MNIGPDNFGSGSSKTDDRFSGPLGGYRGSARAGEQPVEDLSPRNGSSSLSGTTIGGTAIGVSMSLDSPIGSSMAAPKLAEPSLSDLGSLSTPLSEPMFGRDAWLDAPTGSLADHPLLRGLLLELPPKGSMPQQDWLDRWFEAARSILELIYSQEARS
jgi:hypothetical protein